MKKNILCCVLALLLTVSVSAIADEAPKKDPAQVSEVKVDPAEVSEVKAQPEKERLHVQYFRVYYDPSVPADRLSGIEAISIHAGIYARKYESEELEPQFYSDVYSNGARVIVWFEHKPAAASSFNLLLREQ